MSFYGTETEEALGSPDLYRTCERPAGTAESTPTGTADDRGGTGCADDHEKNFEYFLACLKELPDTNASGMLLRVNGLDVQGSLLRDVKKKKKKADRRSNLDMLHFEKGIYCAFVESGVLQGMWQLIRQTSV